MSVNIGGSVAMMALLVGKDNEHMNMKLLRKKQQKFVLDAYRKGGKLKFANHSPNLNFYVKVIMVDEDNKVNTFAKERMNAGKELLRLLLRKIELLLGLES
ncbi:hypothetical protein M9H77_04938 [Catharanthus roseus]|uniref:Uncharacterized protein n=1 Tax=Catharanthus roseus TaxID=4058 RepID=A0ACC0CFM6_CATRO|nr:hypothetical protein M9H77_04938 [Catharanthus roseus]